MSTPTTPEELAIDLIAAVWTYLDATDGDESGIFDIIDQAVKTWKP